MEVALYIGVVIVTSLASVFLARDRRPMIPNRSLTDIQGRHHAEEAYRKVEQAAREAIALAEKIQREAEADRERARARQEEADRAIARATEETRLMMVQMETIQRAAWPAQGLAGSAAKTAKSEVDRLLQETREEKERSRGMQEDIEKAAISAREDVESKKSCRGRTHQGGGWKSASRGGCPYGRRGEAEGA